MQIYVGVFQALIRKYQFYKIMLMGRSKPRAIVISYQKVNKKFRNNSNQTPKIRLLDPQQENLRSYESLTPIVGNQQVNFHHNQQRQLLEHKKSSLVSSIGLIKAQWMAKNSVAAVSFSSGFAISPNIVVSCAHSLFDSKQYYPCNNAVFLPVDGLSQANHVHSTKARNFIRYPSIPIHTSYSFKPLRQDFAVLLLDQPVKTQQYCILAEQTPEQEDFLELWGYPSSNYMNSTPAVGSNFRRSDLQGKFIRSKGDKQGEYVLVHNMLAQVGHSGSPILMLSKDKKVRVAGLHTHKGMDAGTGEGLLISVIRKQIIGYAVEMLREHGMKAELRELMEIQKISHEDYDYFERPP